MNVRWSEIGLVLIGVAMLAAAAVASIKEAGAHQAPSGWKYPMECCHSETQRDCYPVPLKYIHETEEGYRVELPPGVHPNLPNGGSHLYGWDAVYDGKPKIRDSGDNEWHVCARNLYVDSPSWFCLYKPNGGV